MGLRIIPANILRRMAPEERKPLGAGGVLPEEADAKAAKIAEKKLQEQCESWLRRNNLFYLRMPMHKPTSIRVGWPDYTLVLPGGRAVLIEIKVAGGRVSEDQKILHEEYQSLTGHKVEIVVNYDQFVALLTELLASGSNGGVPKTPSTSQSH